jgi:hypothetical protein
VYTRRPSPEYHTPPRQLLSITGLHKFPTNIIARSKNLEAEYIINGNTVSGTFLLNEIQIIQITQKIFQSLLQVEYVKSHITSKHTKPSDEYDYNSRRYRENSIRHGE